MLLLGLWLSSLFALPIYVCVVSTPAWSIVRHVLVSSTFCFLSSAFLGSGWVVGVASFGEGSVQCFGAVPILVTGVGFGRREVSAGRLRSRQWVALGRGCLSVRAYVICMQCWDRASCV